jgi:hypothetical protein
MPTTSENHRKDHQQELVYELMSHERLDELPAAHDVELPSRP